MIMDANSIAKMTWKEYLHDVFKLQDSLRMRVLIDKGPLILGAYDEQSL